MKKLVWVAALAVLWPAGALAHPGPEAHDSAGNIIPGTVIAKAGQVSTHTHTHAERPLRFQQGSWEVFVGSSPTGSGNTVGVGYYVVDQLSFSVSGSALQRHLRSTTGSTWEREDYAYGFGLDYTLPVKWKVVPYFGSSISFITNSGTGPAAPYDNDTNTHIVNGGLRLLVGDNAAVNFSLAYTFIRSYNNLSGQVAEADRRGASLSFSLFF